MLQWEKVLKSIRRCQGRIVGVRSTEQSVGIKVGGFCPRHLHNFNKPCEYEKNSEKEAKKMVKKC